MTVQSEAEYEVEVLQERKGREKGTDGGMEGMMNEGRTGGVSVGGGSGRLRRDVVSAGQCTWLPLLPYLPASTPRQKRNHECLPPAALTPTQPQPSSPAALTTSCLLTDWTQRVLLDGSSSDTVPVSSGVPHGTVLGLLLFLLYINDLPLSTRNSSTRLFADDSLLYKAVKTPDDCRLLQQNLDALQQW